MKNLNIKKIKLFFALVISFFAITLLSPQVFLANTPRINPMFVYTIQQLPSNTLAFLNNSFRSPTQETSVQKQNAILFSQMPPISPPPNLLYKTVSKGIQVATDPITKKSYAKFDMSVPFKTVEIEINGEKLKFIVPQQ
jgi:hypothetical protein